jgi:4-hydroxy-tetrahydrodipicolinate synthase
MAGEMLKAMAGVDMVAVAFRGSNEARTAVIGGQVPIMFDGIPTMKPQIEAGRVRGLATTALRRDLALPSLPAVAEAVPGLPIVMYNVPGRTVADMQHDTVIRLAQVPGIVGIKEATGNLERAQWLIRDVPQGFAVYSGDDPTAVATMLCGGSGNISVTANIAPRLMHELCMAALAGDVKKAMAIQFKLMPVHKNLFVEANPIPVKWAMERMGLCNGTLRLPLTSLSASYEPVVEAALRASGLI